MFMFPSVAGSAVSGSFICSFIEVDFFLLESSPQQEQPAAEEGAEEEEEDTDSMDGSLMYSFVEEENKHEGGGRRERAKKDESRRAGRKRNRPTSRHSSSSDDDDDDDDDDDEDDDREDEEENEKEEEEDMEAWLGAEVKEMDGLKWRAVPSLRAREIGKNSAQFARSVCGSRGLVQRLELQARLERHSGCVNTLHFNPSGTRLASGSDDLRVVIWDWARRRTVLEFDSGHKSNVFQVRPVAMATLHMKSNAIVFFFLFPVKPDFSVLPDLFLSVLLTSNKNFICIPLSVSGKVSPSQRRLHTGHVCP